MSEQVDHIINYHRNMEGLFCILKHYDVNPEYIVDLLVSALSEDADERTKRMMDVLEEFKKQMDPFYSEVQEEVTEEEISAKQGETDELDDSIFCFDGNDQVELFAAGKVERPRSEKIYSIQYFGTKKYHIQDKEGNAKCGYKGNHPQVVIVSTRKINCKRCVPWLKNPEGMTFVDV